MNIRLLKDLDFVNKINQAEAVTEAGKEMLKTYRAYLYTNAPTCGIVNGFVLEAQRFSFDTGLVSILNSVQDYINENNISWKLASACESIASNPSSYSYIAKVGIETVSKLVEMKEQDVVSYIKAGSLKSVQYIPEFRAICKEVYNTAVNETRTPQYTLVSPISYCFEGENHDFYFNVLGKTFKIAESKKIYEATLDDKNFKEINALLEGFGLDGDNITTSYRGVHGDIATVTIKENAEGKSVLEFTKNGEGQLFEAADKFMEFANTQSKIMNVAEKMNWMRFAAVVSKVFENAENIRVVDNARVLTTVDGTIAAIIEGKENVNLTVFRSLNAGTSSNEYQYMAEALQNVMSICGIDLKSQYSERISEDCKKQDPDGFKKIQETLEAEKEAAMQARKKKIAVLAEQFKNDPVKIALLNKAAQDLAILG